MTRKQTHDAYIAAAPAQFRAILGQLRARLSRALPDAEEVMKYDMPGFQIEGTIIAGYAAFSKQCGLYVDPGAVADHADDIASARLKGYAAFSKQCGLYVDPGAVADHADDIAFAGLKATKTGVTFSARTPISDDLVEKLATSSRRKKGL